MRLSVDRIHRAGALATGCGVEITKTGATFELRQNKALGLFHSLIIDRLF